MELDQLLNLTSVVANKLLPILGVVALIFLIIFLRKLIALMISSNAAVDTMKTTLDTANRQIEALDKPLQTINDLSETIDNVHEASKNVLRSALVALIDNIGNIMQVFTGDKHKTEETVEEVVEQARGECNHEPNN